MANVRIEIARTDQKEAIRNFLSKYFRVDEPITRSANVTKEEVRGFFDELAGDGLKSPVSFVALNEKNEVVACRLNEIVDLHTPNHQGQECAACHYPDSVKKVTNFLDILTKDFEKLLSPDTKRIMKFIAVSVHPDYQRRGIAKELIEKSLRVAVDNQCDYVCTGATAVRSQQLFAKLGFETLRIISHKDYRDPKTNEQILNCDDGTDCGKFMAKKLNNS